MLDLQQLQILAQLVDTMELATKKLEISVNPMGILTTNHYWTYSLWLMQ